MDSKYKWLVILVTVFIIDQTQAADYKRFENIYPEPRYHYGLNLFNRHYFGEYIAANDKSFFLLNVTYEKIGNTFNKPNYTVIIDVPQDSRSSENITRYACVSNISTSINNPVLTKEWIAKFGTELPELYSSDIRLVATERLSQEKVMIIWNETYYSDDHRREHKRRSDVIVTIVIFDVKTCTPSTIQFIADFDVKQHNINVVLYEDSFDIFTCGRKLCKSPTSKMSFDFSGHQIGDTIYLKTQLNEDELTFPTPILKSSIPDGFYTLISSVDDERTKLLAYLSRDGTKQEILTNNPVYIRKQIYDGMVIDPVASDSNGKYTVCQLNHGTPYCLRFIEENMISNITLKYPQRVTYAEVYNSGDGGFYLVTRYCNFSSCDEYTIMKINSDGDLVKLISIPKSDSKCYATSKNVFDLSKNISEFCIHSLCGSKNDSFSVFCIPKSELDL